MFAAKLQGAVADERAWQEPRLAEDLESVANSQHRPAFRGETPHRLHDRAETGNGPGAQIISITEAAGDDDGVKAGQRTLLVPDKSPRLAENVPHHVQGVLVAIGSGKLEDGEIHFTRVRGDSLRSPDC